ncbi:MAG: hypothetical protein LBT40_04575 [Deltaproteobacteria bacterium]|jgi:hypothetical protein|nr:hypothetical protein [Deltaproteobacteria bacterium]
MELTETGSGLFPGAVIAALALLLLFAAVLLVSCGDEKNPILGEWDVTVRTGNSGVDAAVGIFTAMKQPTVTFTETEMQFQIMGPAGGTRPVSYNRDKDSRWMVCFGTEATQCQFFTFQDEQRTRAVFTIFGMDLALTRRPEPPPS